MSVNRENVIWQSPDGTWNRGFYEVRQNFSGDDEEHDYEWDVDYNYDVFEWASTGHPTEESANDSWRGANPGGNDGATGAEAVARLDDLAAVLSESGHHGYSGPPKQRTALALSVDRNALELDQHRYEFDGYSNDNKPRIRALQAAIDSRPPATAIEKAAIAEADAHHLKSLRELSARQHQNIIGRGSYRDSRMSQKRGLHDGLNARIEALAESLRPKAATTTGPKQKPRSGRKLRDGDTGQPTVNEGRFAAVKKSAPSSTSLGSQDLGN